MGSTQQISCILQLNAEPQEREIDLAVTPYIEYLVSCILCHSKPSACKCKNMSTCISIDHLANQLSPQLKSANCPGILDCFRIIMWATNFLTTAV